MRTTLVINEELLNEAKTLSGAKTTKEAIEVALPGYIRRRKAKRLLQLEGKMELSCPSDEFLKNRERDVPDR